METNKYALLGDFPAERFWASIKKTPGCWLWTKSLKPNGYGQLGHKRQTFYAHRISYILAKGPIPKNLVVDHICRNRACVNPAHLRAVTQRANVVENSDSISVVNSRKRFCPKGHPYSGESLQLEHSRKGLSRRCRICRKESQARIRAARSPEEKQAKLQYWREYNATVRRAKKKPK